MLDFIGILLSVICLLFSLICWIVFFNIKKLRLALDRIDVQLIYARNQLPDFQKKIQTYNFQEMLLNPSLLIKLAEIFILLRQGSLSKLGLMKALMK